MSTSMAKWSMADLELAPVVASTSSTSIVHTDVTLPPPAPSTLKIYCPKCEDPTPLPYMCRGCWRALGHSGQVAYYRKKGRGKPDQCNHAFCRGFATGYSVGRDLLARDLLKQIEEEERKPQFDLFGGQVEKP